MARTKVGSLMRGYFIAGLVVWLPIWATYVVIKFIFNLMDGTLELIPVKYRPDALFGVHVPGLGLIITLAIIFLTGLLMTNFVGHRLVAVWEKLLSRIPLIRSIHSAVKQVLHALLQPSSTSFRKVLLIEFPRKDIWSIAFQTSDRFPHSPKDNEEMITCFVPTTPNPTSGFLTILPKKHVIELNITIEEALRMVISLGVITPENMKTLVGTEATIKTDSL